MQNFIFSKRRGVLLLGALLLAAGILLVDRLPIKLYPNTKKPMVGVFISHPGFTAEDFHLQYSRLIEEKLTSVREADRVEANYGNGRTRYIIEFDWEVDGEEAKNRVDNTMSTLDSALPEESRDYGVYHWSAENMGFLAASIYSREVNSKELYQIVEPVLKPEFAAVEDAESVEIVNVEELKAEITLKPLSLLRYGITAPQAAQAVRNNYKPEPVGSFQAERSQYNIRIKHGIESIFEIGNIVVDVRENQKILLKDIAEVSVRYDLPGQIFRSNGERSILVFATPKNDGNIKKMSDDVKQIIEEAKSSLPEHVQYSYLVDPAVFINRAIMNVVKAALLGALLAVAIIIILLGELKNTFIIALSLPLSMIFSFILMYFFDVTVNLISLGGMTLSVGMIIDSSIVVMENIHRHRKEAWEEKRKVTLKDVITTSVTEVRGAVIAAALTSICVFLPLSFTAPLTNALLGDLAKTVIFALSCSLVTALVIIPIVAYYLFRKKKQPGVLFKQSPLTRVSDGIMEGITGGYIFLLRGLLKSRVLTALFVLLSFSLLAGGVIYLSPKITQEIIAEPKSDKLVLGYMKYDSQSKEELLEAVGPIEEDLLTNYGDMVESLFAQVNSATQGNFIIALKSSRYTDEMTQELNEKYQSSTQWRYYVFPWDPSRLPLPRILDLEVKFSGPDKKTILALMERGADLIRKEDLYRNVYTDPSTNTSEELVLYPRKEVIDLFPQFSLASLSGTARMAMHGSQVVEMNEGGRKISVQMEYPRGTIASEEDFLNFLLPYQGKAIPLKHFFDLEREKGVMNIATLDGKESFSIFAQMKEDTPNDMREEYENRVRSILEENLELPEGYSFTLEDTRELIDNSIRSLIYALGASILLIYLILAFQFNSLRVPFVILVTVPLGFIGVIGSLYIFQSTISLNSLLGMILLGGIVVNNAIIMIDFYFQSLAKFQVKREAILYAARLRFPPIIITMATTVLGMLPIALALGDGTNIIQPLGIAVSGGLVVSTLFTLFMVPTILNMMDSGKNAKEMYPALFGDRRPSGTDSTGEAGNR